VHGVGLSEEELSSFHLTQRYYGVHRMWRRLEGIND